MVGPKSTKATFGEGESVNVELLPAESIARSERFLAVVEWPDVSIASAEVVLPERGDGEHAERLVGLHGRQRAEEIIGVEAHDGLAVDHVVYQRRLIRERRLRRVVAATRRLVHPIGDEPPARLHACVRPNPERQPVGRHLRFRREVERERDDGCQHGRLHPPQYVLHSDPSFGLRV